MSEIKFKRDTAFRKQLFVPDSFAHPAKMDSQLLIWIVEKYTKPGEIILDPMAGSGTTMLACMLGRNVVLVELEEKFCKMCRDNWELVKMHPQLGSFMGWCEIYQGDARNLEGLLADKIITSPPYSDISMGGGLNTKPPREGHNDQSGRSPISPSQAGAGRYDSIITSPPHGDAYSIREGGQVNQEYVEKRKEVLRKQGKDKLADSLRVEEYGSHNPQNIGNKPYGNIDSIITSPPYEGSISADAGGERDQSSARQREARLRNKGYDPAKYQGGVGRNLEVDFQYSKADDNIGNLKSDSYLSAMLQVYQQCHKVLKPQGLMILVTKNFIRDKQVVRLDSDTIRLCEQAGFKFLERHYRKLPSQSFWRVIYHQKYPEVEKLEYEDVLTFQRKE